MNPHTRSPGSASATLLLVVAILLQTTSAPTSGSAGVAPT